MSRFKQGLMVATIMLMPATHSFAVSSPEVEVYKSPTCGCCSEWVRHLEKNGFRVISHDVSNLDAYKRKAGLPRDLASCHTAFVEGYAVEGHVPAVDIRRMLKEQPDIQGIAVPGMPMGSPGMEYGSRKDPYQVVSFTSKGALGVYAEH